METLTVTCQSSVYPIYIDSNVFSKIKRLTDVIRSRQVMIVTNDTVAPLYLAKLQSLLLDYQCDVTILPDGEQHKTLENLAKIFDKLIECKHHRDTTLIALGGGVIGDMTGFAASCYQRGVHFLQVPTTLLAQVDASVGGKTAVNFAGHKNIVGAFYQPQAVFIDLDMLKTLDKRHLRAGLAEVVKVAMLKDDLFFHWIRLHSDELLSLAPEALLHAVSRSCQIKAEIVNADEKEQGIRALLNLGHTFAHGIESVTQYREYLHGEAVSIGMVLAGKLACQEGFLAENDLKQLIDLLEKLELPTKLNNKLDPLAIYSAMLMDKKIINEKVRLILPTKIGNAEIFEDIQKDSILKILGELN